MTQAKGADATVQSLLRDLSESELARLHDAVVQHRGQTIDLRAAIAALRGTPTSRLPTCSKWRAEVSGGRHYELILMAQGRGLGDPFRFADQQCEREWAEVEAMTAGGAMNYADAWRTMRDRYGTTEDDIEPNLLASDHQEDARGSGMGAMPVPRLHRGALDD